MLIPLLGVITECSIPTTLLAPYVADTNQSQLLLLELSNIDDAIVMILQDAMSTRISILGTLRFNVIHTTQMELQIEGVHQQLPKLITLDHLQRLLILQ